MAHHLSLGDSAAVPICVVAGLIIKVRPHYARQRRKLVCCQLRIQSSLGRYAKSTNLFIIELAAASSSKPIHSSALCNECVDNFDRHSCT